MPARVKVLQGEQRQSWHQAQSPAIPSHQSLTLDLMLSWEDRADKKEQWETQGRGGATGTGSSRLLPLSAEFP